MQERLRPQEIESVSLERIVPEEVILITNSAPGAMGESGLFELFSIHEGHVLCFCGNWIDRLDRDEVNKHLPDSVSIDEACSLRANYKDWSVFGGGMGNKFVIRKEYYPELHDRCLLTPLRYYRDCIAVAENYLVEIANGFPAQKLPSEEIAKQLVRFALKEYIESTTGKDMVSAVLWCDVYGLRKDYSCHVKNSRIIPGICENYEQKVVDGKGKYDKAHLRIDFGNKHAVIFRSLSPEQKTITVFDVVIKQKGSEESSPYHIAFENGRPLAALETLDEVRPGITVKHKEFGDGQVTWIDAARKYIRVKFTVGEKQFIFPDAFIKGFLKK